MFIMPFLIQHSAGRLGRVKGFGRVDFPFEKDKLIIAPALARMLPVPLVCQVVLERHQDVTSKLTFIGSCLRVRLTLQKRSEESLDQVLCITARVTPSAHEAIKRWPIVATKLRECLEPIPPAKCAISDQTPMGRTKRGSAVLQGAGDCFHRCRIWDCKEESKAYFSGTAG